MQGGKRNHFGCRFKTPLALCKSIWPLPFVHPPSHSGNLRACHSLSPGFPEPWDPGNPGGGDLPGEETRYSVTTACGFLVSVPPQPSPSNPTSGVELLGRHCGASEGCRNSWLDRGSPHKIAVCYRPAADPFSSRRSRSCTPFPSLSSSTQCTGKPVYLPSTAICTRAQKGAPSYPASEGSCVPREPHSQPNFLSILRGEEFPEVATLPRLGSNLPSSCICLPGRGYHTQHGRTYILAQAPEP